MSNGSHGDLSRGHVQLVNINQHHNRSLLQWWHWECWWEKKRLALKPDDSQNWGWTGWLARNRRAESACGSRRGNAEQRSTRKKKQGKKGKSKGSGIWQCPPHQQQSPRDSSPLPSRPHPPIIYPASFPSPVSNCHVYLRWGILFLIVYMVYINIKYKIILHVTVNSCKPAGVSVHRISR